MDDELRFHDEIAARVWFERQRWPNGPVCPHCGGTKFYDTRKVSVLRCGNGACRKDFSVMTGTVMHGSRVTLPQWARAFHLAASSETLPTATQLRDELGCEFNTGALIRRRLKEAAERGGMFSARRL